MSSQTFQSSIAVLNRDGSMLAGWPKSFSGVVGSLAVADFNNDSKDELVASTFYGGSQLDSGVVTIYSGGGAEMPGWP